MARVEIFQPKTDNYARTVVGIRVKSLMKVVLLEARRHALRYTGNTHPEPTGALARSIHPEGPRRIGRWKLVGSVGSSHPKALLIHDGSRPHQIRPRNAGGLLFYWKVKGRWVCIKGAVDHPGAQGKFYLTTPLRIEGPRLGFRVVTSVTEDRLFR